MFKVHVYSECVFKDVQMFIKYLWMYFNFCESVFESAVTDLY